MLKTLFKPKWQHKNPATRIQAISRLDQSSANDQEIIQQLLKQDTDTSVRLSAAKHCHDLQLLNIHASDADAAVAKACCEQACGLLMAPPASLSNEQVLNFIAQTAKASVLQHLIECGQDNKLCSEALLHIEDQSVLAHLSQHSRSSQQRQTAAQLLQEPALIQQVLNQSKSKDKKVTQILKDKLKQNKLHSQQQAANQVAINDVLGKLKQLSKTEQQSQLNAKLGLITQQWQALSPNSEQQQSFKQLEQQCLGIVAQQAALNAQQQAEQAQQQAIYIQQQTIIEHLEQQLQDLSSAAPDLDLTAQQNTLEQQLQQWQQLLQQQSAKPQTKLNFTNVERKLKQLLPALQTLANKAEQIQAASQASANEADEFKNLQQGLRNNKKLQQSIRWPEGIEQPASLKQLQASIAAQTSALQALEQQQQQIQHTLEQQLQQINQDAEAGHLDKAKSALSKIRQNFAKLDHHRSKNLQHSLHQAQQAVNELKDWQQYATGPKREALCEQMEQLDKTSLPPHAKNKAIKELQQNWRDLGNDQHSKALWQRFKTATDKAYAPCKAEFDKEKSVRLHNGKQRNEICQQLEDYLTQIDFSQANFSDVEKLYRHAADEWKRFAPVERSQHQALQDRFNLPMQQLKQALHQHKSDNIAAKQALVDQAKALLEHEDCQHAISQAKQLQHDWKAIGLSFQKQNQQLWGEFRQACDALFERKNQEQETAKGEREENFQQAQQISQQIQQLSLADGEELQQNQKQVQQLAQSFNNLGALPKQNYQQAKTHFQTSLEQFNQRVKGIPARQQQQALKQLLETSNALEQIEAASPEQQQSLASSFIIPPELPDAWQDQLHQRLQLSLQKSTESQQSAFELLCIKLEIACNQDSPSDYQQQRMQYQMQQLSQSFGQQSSTDLKQAAEDAILTWCQLSSQACENYPALKQRFFTLAQAQLNS